MKKLTQLNFMVFLCFINNEETTIFYHHLQKQKILQIYIQELQQFAGALFLKNYHE